MHNYYDVIIVGAGVSGLFCALHMDSKYKVLIISKDDFTKSNSYLAQGGIAALQDPEDYSTYLEDTLRAGHYKNNINAVEIMIKSSHHIIKELINLGVEFDQENNEFCLTREGAHSINRILHHKDMTGHEITHKLLQQVKIQKHITLKAYHTLIDLLTISNQCKGIVVEHNGSLKAFYAKNVVLATGGVGGLFKNSTNFNHITGDSLGIALKHHITIQDLHAIQIHPTCLYSQGSDRRFLISEALRGEGAYLLNSNGQRFVNELLPRDIVSHAILEQMRLLDTPYVYLSATHLDANKLKYRFPTIYQKCLEEGYDITKDLIPITPAQHYIMGGIKVDTNGQTSMQGLFAIGETSCTGVHGANRLASNSLLEGLVFAKRAGIYLSSSMSIDNATPDRKIDLTSYEPKALQQHYLQLISEEIKRKDQNFYAQWFDTKYQCG